MMSWIRLSAAPPRTCPCAHRVATFLMAPIELGRARQVPALDVLKVHEKAIADHRAFRFVEVRDRRFKERIDTQFAEGPVAGPEPGA